MIHPRDSFFSGLAEHLQATHQGLTDAIMGFESDGESALDAIDAGVSTALSSGAWGIVAGLAQRRHPGEVLVEASIGAALTGIYWGIVAYQRSTESWQSKQTPQSRETARKSLTKLMHHARSGGRTR